MDWNAFGREIGMGLSLMLVMIGSVGLVSTLGKIVYDIRERRRIRGIMER